MDPFDRPEPITCKLLNMDYNLSPEEAVIHEWTPGFPPSESGPSLGSIFREIREYCDTLGYGPCMLDVNTTSGEIRIIHAGEGVVIEATLIIMMP